MCGYTAAFECQRSIELARLGYLLANERLNSVDANQIIYECQPIAGWFPIETVDVDSVYELAVDMWGEQPKLQEYAQRACRRVWNKWESGGEITSSAQEWAIDLIHDYAKDDGVVLEPYTPNDMPL